MFENRNADPPPQRHRDGAYDLARVFLMRRRVLTEIVFAIEIGVTVILGVVVFYMASQALAGREQWAIFIAYVGALRIALGGATAAIQVFAGVSRFYPRVMRYHLFMQDVSKMNNVALAKLQPGDTVILGALQNGTEVVTKVGQRVALGYRRSNTEDVYALIDAHRRSRPCRSADRDRFRRHFGQGRGYRARLSEPLGRRRGQLDSLRSAQRQGRARDLHQRREDRFLRRRAAC